MKKFGYIVLGIWCILTSFVSPVWLTLVFLYVTGLIYKYDFSIDEGIAEVMGVMGIAIWILLVLLPIIFFLKRIKSVDSRAAVISSGIMVLAALLCIAMCGWDVIRFLNVPVGTLMGS
ncbi:MAG: hypothetical protein K2O16_18925 [Lachnospiraceae bacterium]|nr:hypothetical protein [Lachnospiraceae bacterium]